MNFININKEIEKIEKNKIKKINIDEISLENEEKLKLIKMISSKKNIMKNFSDIEIIDLVDILIEWAKMQNLVNENLDNFFDSIIRLSKYINEKDFFSDFLNKISSTDLFLDYSKKINNYLGNHRDKISEKQKNIILDNIKNMENKKEKRAFSKDEKIIIKTDEIKNIDTINEKIKYLSKFMFDKTDFKSFLKQHLEKQIYDEKKPPLSSYVDITINTFSNMKIKIDLLDDRELLTNNIIKIALVNESISEMINKNITNKICYNRKLKNGEKYLDEIILKQTALYINNKINDLFHIFPLIERLMLVNFGEDFCQKIRENDIFSSFGKKCILSILESKINKDNEDDFLGLGLKNFYCHGVFIEINYPDGYLEFKKIYSMIIIPVILEIYNVL